MDALQSIDTKRFWDEGWTVVRDVFTGEEARGMRERVFRSLRARERGELPNCDLLADPHLSDVVHDDRLLAIARTVLEGQPVYFGDASYAVVGRGYDEHDQATGYHRDNTDRSDTSAPDWRGRYSLIRFGIYLQDHRRHSGGLMVRTRSHDRILRGWRNYLYDRYLDTRPGDVGLWSMRIQHSGVGRFWRGFPRMGIPPSLWNKVPPFLQSPRWNEERAAVWVSYGLDDAHLHRHCEYLLGRSERLEMWRNSRYDAQTLRACESAGLKVIDMPGRMRAALAEGRPVGQHAHHYQLPY